MAQAFVVCRTTGTGTEEDPYRPIVADLPKHPQWTGGPVNWVAVMKPPGALVKLRVRAEDAALAAQLIDNAQYCWRVSEVNWQHELTENEWNWLADKAGRMDIADIPAYQPRITLLGALRWLARHWEPAFTGDMDWDVIEP